VRPTNGNGSLSWQTPKEARGDYGYPNGDKTNPFLTLSGQVKYWPTIQVADSKDAKANKRGNPHLNAVVNWPTPAAQNYRDGRASAEIIASNSRPLQEVVISGLLGQDSLSTNGKNPELWQAVKTPGGGDKNRSGKRKRELLLGGQVSGKLNPDWVEQLMGLPVGWTLI